jgi:hypothetical protein
MNIFTNTTSTSNKVSTIVLDGVNIRLSSVNCPRITGDTMTIIGTLAGDPGMIQGKTIQLIDIPHKGFHSPYETFQVINIEQLYNNVSIKVWIG